MNRLETLFGNDGFGEPSDLRAFSALYRFEGRTFGITVWALDRAEAQQHCEAHGMRLDGELIERIDA